MFLIRIATIFVVLLFGITPSPCHAQSLSDLLKFVPNTGSANDIVGAIKSLSEVTLGQVESGTGPENAGEKIILYRTASCSYCKRAAAYMRKRNIGFAERDIEKNSSYNSEFRRLGGVGVPFIVLRDKTMSGFNESSFEQYYADFKRSVENAPNPTPGMSTASNGSLSSLAIQSGDVMVGKITGVAVYIQPMKSEKLTVLGRSEEIIYMGKERDGFYQVTTQKGEGWVDKLLVKKQ